MLRLTLTTGERGDVDSVVPKRCGTAALAQRTRSVLFGANSERRVDIGAKLACNDAFFALWTRAFEFQGLARLVSPLPGPALVRYVAKLEVRALDRTLKQTPRTAPQTGAAASSRRN